MANMTVGAPAPSTYIPPTGDPILDTSGAGNKGILFTQANLEPELKMLKTLIIELRKPSRNAASADDKKSGNVGGPSDADLNMLLGEIDELVTNLKYKTGKTKLGMDDQHRKKFAEASAAALKTANDKLKEAQDAAGVSTTMGWIMAGLAMAGAILLCAVTIIGAVASGGAGAFAIIGCVAAVLLAVQMIADMSLKEAGTQYTACTGETKQLSVGMDGMVDAICDREIVNGDIVVVRQNADGNYVDKDNNVIPDPHKGAKSTAIFFTPEELSDWKMGWTITTTIIVALALGGVGKLASMAADKAAKLASVVEAGAKGANAVKSASSAARWSSSLETAGLNVAGGAGVAAAVTAICKGVIDIYIANLNADSEKARADKAFYDVQSQDAAHAWDMTMDFLKEIVTQYLENGQARSKNVADRGRTAAGFTRPIMS